MLNHRRSAGFTLIELVVVITILGILAAFAVPKFAAIEVRARIAATQSLAGSVRSAAALAHGMWLASGSPANIAMDGTPIALAFGYPTNASIIQTLQDSSGFNAVAVGAGIRFSPTSTTTPATCSCTYTAAAAAITAPTISVPNVSAC